MSHSSTSRRRRIRLRLRASGTASPPVRCPARRVRRRSMRRPRRSASRRRLRRSGAFTTNRASSRFSSASSPGSRAAKSLCARTSAALPAVRSSSVRRSFVRSRSDTPPKLPCGTGELAGSRPIPDGTETRPGSGPYSAPDNGRGSRRTATERGTPAKSASKTRSNGAICSRPVTNATRAAQYNAVRSTGGSSRNASRNRTDRSGVTATPARRSSSPSRPPNSARSKRGTAAGFTAAGPRPASPGRVPVPAPGPPGT